MSRNIIAQIGDKNKGADYRALTKDFCTHSSQGSSKYKVGVGATDGSESCRPIVRILTTDSGFVYYSLDILWGCPEHTVVKPSETTQPLLLAPLSAAKYKVGDVATVHLGNSYRFTCRRIVRIERYLGQSVSEPRADTGSQVPILPPSPKNDQQKRPQVLGIPCHAYSVGVLFTNTK